MRSGPKQKESGDCRVKSLTRETLRLVERSYWRRRLFECAADEAGGFAGEADSGEQRRTSSRGYISPPAQHICEGTRRRKSEGVRIVVSSVDATTRPDGGSGASLIEARISQPPWHPLVHPIWGKPAWVCCENKYPCGYICLSAGALAVTK